jgi:ferredoxin-NADP reductase
VARAAVLGRLTWQQAEVVELVPETPRVKTIVLEPAEWGGHRPGQHVDVRLTAEDGYQASRSYSIASAPENGRLSITVERLEDGEVSPFLVDELRVGDRFELRGPIGGYFVWDVSLGGPVLLVAGGSGVVPFGSMLRHRAAVASNVPARLLLSARTQEDLIYRRELDDLGVRRDGFEVFYTLTRGQPSGWTGLSGRVDADKLATVAFPPDERPHVLVCGPTGFVETATSTLVELGHDPLAIKAERFGGS